MSEALRCPKCQELFSSKGFLGAHEKTCDGGGAVDAEFTVDGQVTRPVPRLKEKKTRARTQRKATAPPDANELLNRLANGAIDVALNSIFKGRK